MASYDERRVRELGAVCHPGWPARPEHWYFVNPTLVACEGTEILGHASLTVDSQPGGLSAVLYLRDTVVGPEARGRGVATELMRARIAIGRSVGCSMSVGCTWPENIAVRKIHERFGFHACQRVPGYFAYNTPPADGIIYVLAGAHEG